MRKTLSILCAVKNTQFRPKSDSAGEYGYYWSSARYESLPYNAYFFYLYSSDYHSTNAYRLYGLSVRAVTE